MIYFSFFCILLLTIGKVHSKIKPSNRRSIPSCHLIRHPIPSSHPLPLMMLFRHRHPVRRPKKCPRLRLQLHTLFRHRIKPFVQMPRMHLSRPCRRLWLPSCRRIIFWRIGRKSCRAILVTAVRHLIRWFIIHRISISFLTGALPSIVIRWKSPIIKCAAFLNGSTAKATRMTRLP